MDLLNDSIFPQNSSFGPEDLFLNLPESELPEIAESYPTPIKASPPQRKISIKLKKVKHPKSSRLSQEKFYKTQREDDWLCEVIKEQPSYLQDLEEDLDHLILQNTPEASPVTSPLYSPSMEESICSSRIDETLQDLSLQNTDSLLDLLLESCGTPVQSSFQVAPDIEEEKPVIMKEEQMDKSSPILLCARSPVEFFVDEGHFEIVPLDSSPFHDSLAAENLTYYHSSASPSTSVDFSDASPMHSEPLSPLYSPSSDRIEGNSSPSTKKKSRKSKGDAPRQKLSAELRRQRKREQNKEAALRYRNKRRSEDHEFHKQIEDAERQNREMKQKQTELKQEISIIKNLLRSALLKKKH